VLRFYLLLLAQRLQTTVSGRDACSPWMFFDKEAEEFAHEEKKHGS
jgi:hypothetical protein